MNYTCDASMAGNWGTKTAKKIYPAGYKRFIGAA